LKRRLKVKRAKNQRTNHVIASQTVEVAEVDLVHQSGARLGDLILDPDRSHVIDHETGGENEDNKNEKFQRNFDRF
jgi:hypothetical protein